MKDKLEGFFRTLSMLSFSLFIMLVFSKGCRPGPPPPTHVSDYIMFGGLILTIVFFLLSTVSWGNNEKTNQKNNHKS